jgi:hypothetical protein
VGYEIDAEIPEPPGMKPKFTYDLVISRKKWEAVSTF